MEPAGGGEGAAPGWSQRGEARELHQGGAKGGGLTMVRVGVIQVWDSGSPTKSPTLVHLRRQVPFTEEAAA